MASKRHVARLDRLVEGTPVMIVEDGTPLQDRMSSARVDESDILGPARKAQELER